MFYLIGGGGGNPPFAFQILQCPYFMFTSISLGDFCSGWVLSWLHKLPWATCSESTWPCPTGNPLATPKCLRPPSHAHPAAPSQPPQVSCTELAASNPHIDLVTPTHAHLVALIWPRPPGCCQSSHSPRRQISRIVIHIQLSSEQST